MSDQYGPHSSGNLISDGKRTQLYAGETGPIDHDPLLYTQAQVDALVAAERERCIKIADGAAATPPQIGPLYNAGIIAASNHIAANIRGGK